MTAVDAAPEYWLKDRSREGRDRLLGAYRYLQVRAARKFYRSGLDRADSEQIAAIGLIKACDRYDPALKTPFEAFAWLFIVGELMHYVGDGQRIVLGGLLRDVDMETISRLPGLADIPIIGKLFQDRRRTRERDEVVFLITPHVIYPAKS